MERVAVEPLPDFDVFLRQWRDLVQEACKGECNHQWDLDSDRWLREAVRRMDGTEGLAGIARSDSSVGGSSSLVPGTDGGRGLECCPCRLRGSGRNRHRQSIFRGRFSRRRRSRCAGTGAQGPSRTPRASVAQSSQHVAASTMARFIREQGHIEKAGRCGIRSLPHKSTSPESAPLYTARRF